MFFSQSPKGMIIQCISRSCGLTTGQIIHDLAHQYIVIKQAQIYHLIKEMVRERILYKQWSLLRLHPQRIAQIRWLIGDIEHHEQIIQMDINTLTTKRIVLDCFLDLNNVWPYYASLLFTHTQTKEQRKYSRHHLYTIGWYRQDLSQPWYFSLPEVTRYEVCSGDKWLDLHALTIKEQGECFSWPHHLLWFTGYNINIIGDYILSIHFSPRLHQLVEEMYRSVTDIDTFDVAYCRSLCEMKESCILLISHNPGQANLRKKELSKYVKTVEAQTGF